MNDKLKVALIDSHLLIRKGIARLLEGFGYSVHLQCNNGEEFITSLDKNNLPDIVITDIPMPVMDGIETTKWIKAVHADELDHVRPAQIDHLFWWRRRAVHG